MDGPVNLEATLGELYPLLINFRKSAAGKCSFLDIANNLVAAITEANNWIVPGSDNSIWIEIQQQNIPYLKRYLELLRDFPEFARQECSVQAKYAVDKDYVDEQYRRLRGKSPE
jgi:hypothetical protein